PVMPDLSTRDGYPLYFAIAALVLRLAGGEPAHALNLTSAIESALACGVLSLVAAELSGSAIAGLASALLFAASYTMWSQSVIAEVYGLHALSVALTLWLVFWWEARPSLTRLGVFFAVYALGFGHHLSMILLAPAYAFFFLSTAPDGGRSMIRPPVGVATWLLRISRRGVLVAGVYLANVLFAYRYNVGDTHVFYLPSHLAVALMIAPGIVLAARPLQGLIATKARKHETYSGLISC